MDLIDKMQVKDNTKMTYKKKLNYVTNKLDINYTNNETDIINKLKKAEVEEPINFMLDYINIIYVLRKSLNLSNEELLKYRTHMFGRRTLEPTETNKHNILEKLPNLEELHRYTLDLFNRKKYKQFIINFLIIHACCRNKDLDLFITSEEPKDNEQNYLWIKDAEAVYYRNVYKTVDKHDQKIHFITDKNLIQAGKQLINQYLLKNHGGNICKEILEATYNKLGQGRYLKIKILETNYNDLHKIGESRGTSADTIMSHYNINKSTGKA